uniref:ERAP1_C domain-containing protein n=1 Tax=Macrostomum lignano TaxID=282301 RepID=A0A1I8FF68_9PLAT
MKSENHTRPDTASVPKRGVVLLSELFDERHDRSSRTSQREPWRTGGLIIYRFLTLAVYDPVYTQTLEKQNVGPEVITTRRLRHQTDSMLHSHHPIIMARGCPYPSEIESLFDDISYFKAYRKINQNSGAHSNSPAENLTRVMDTWTTQVNYPLVTVRISGNRLHFRQERFLLYPNGTQIWESHQTKYNYKWIIPVMYLTDKTPEPMWTLAGPGGVEDSGTGPHTPAFVKINLNQTGLYRCNYEFSNWQQLVKLSRQGYFGSTDMAGLLNDAFTLAYIGRLNISVPFDLFETLEEDRLDSAAPPGQSLCVK